MVGVVRVPTVQKRDRCAAVPTSAPQKRLRTDADAASVLPRPTLLETTESLVPESSSRALLRKLELMNFKALANFSFGMQEGVSIVVGPNASGKTSISDALDFLLLNPCCTDLSSIFPRCCTEDDETIISRLTTSVTGHFDSLDIGHIALRREASRSPCGTILVRSFVARGADAEMLSVSDVAYKTWLTMGLRWRRESLGSATAGVAADIALPQFGFMGTHSVETLLERVGTLLGHRAEQVAAVDGVPRPMSSLLKRRGSTSAISSVAVQEAWAARRIDDAYQDLTRQPLDESMLQWSEGGQASLRRGGAPCTDDALGAPMAPSIASKFSLLLSRQRGCASTGRGLAVRELCDADHDLCALALLFTLSGLEGNSRDAAPAFAILDEPDARLDKGHAAALLRFLRGQSGPRQTLMLSLNNHSAFTEVEGAIFLNGIEAGR